MKDVTVIEGVIAFNGEGGWGVEYEDGHTTSLNFVRLNKARICNPEFCKKPEHMVSYTSYYLDKLSKAKLVKVKRTIITEIIE